jgi:hypothetical protein
MSRHVFKEAVDSHNGVIRAVDLRPKPLEVVASGVVLELENS